MCLFTATAGVGTYHRSTDVAPHYCTFFGKGGRGQKKEERRRNLTLFFGDEVQQPAKLEKNRATHDGMQPFISSFPS